MVPRQPVMNLASGDGWRMPVGAAPGSLLADASADPTRVTLTTWTSEREPETRELAADDDLTPPPGVQCWYDVTGLRDVDWLARLGDQLGLHMLALEDITHTVQRPKFEAFGAAGFVVLRMTGERPRGDQGATWCHGDVLVSFREHPCATFDGPRQRLAERPAGRMRLLGVTAVQAALLDACVDGWAPTVEAQAEDLDELEDMAFDGDEQVVHAVHDARRSLGRVARAVRPLAQVVERLRQHHGQPGGEVDLVLRDVLDHVTLMSERTEGLRDRCSSLVDVSLAVSGHRLNEVMRTLTVTATLFIPLTFIAGVYGMNFDPDASALNMPETRWAWGYPAVMGVMALTAVALIVWFRRRGWIGGGGPARPSSDA